MNNRVIKFLNFQIRPSCSIFRFQSFEDMGIFELWDFQTSKLWNYSILRLLDRRISEYCEFQNFLELYAPNYIYKSWELLVSRIVASFNVDNFQLPNRQIREISKSLKRPLCILQIQRVNKIYIYKESGISYLPDI